MASLWKSSSNPLHFETFRLLRYCFPSCSSFDKEKRYIHKIVAEIKFIAMKKRHVLELPLFGTRFDTGIVYTCAKVGYHDCASFTNLLIVGSVMIASMS